MCIYRVLLFLHVLSFCVLWCFIISKNKFFLAYSLDQIQFTKSSFLLSFHVDFCLFLPFLIFLFFLLLNKLISSSDDSNLEMVSSETFLDLWSTWFNSFSSSAIFILILFTLPCADKRNPLAWRKSPSFPEI